ncbi:MAG TPA: isoprenyl transferase [Caulobacterales bacterium]|nr:isoprenyl transferase [Caulobacterales bacterium]
MIRPKMSIPAETLATDVLPRHVAVIMDGNGRWARARGRPRTFGHSEGVEALRRAVEAAGELNIEYLTVFGFSTENWRRPIDEVNALFDLLRLYVARDLDRLAREGVRVRVIGAREDLARDIREIIQNAETKTADNTRLNLTIAFNYGAQGEIVRAARRIAADAISGALKPEAITEAMFESYLDTAGLPPPDLLIRTSGEQRMSNFLLWQAAYAELVFLDVLWPDFDRAALEQALGEYRRRDRRFGRSEYSRPG